MLGGGTFESVFISLARKGDGKQGMTEVGTCRIQPVPITLCPSSKTLLVYEFPLGNS